MSPKRIKIRIVTLFPGMQPGIGNLEVDADFSFLMVLVSRERKRPEHQRDGGRQGQDQCGQATKGMWGMSRRQQAMKGVEDCDKPGVTVKQVLIPGFPN
jgi:hypothetical protein